MGTSNFYIMNASRAFAVMEGETYEKKVCENCNKDYPEWEYDIKKMDVCPICGGDLEQTTDREEVNEDDLECLKESVGSQVVERFKGDKNINITDEDENDWNRNFPGHKFLRIVADRDFGDVYVSVTVWAVIRSGYYEGANLDWEREFSDGYDVSDKADFDFDDVSDMNAGMKKIQQAKANAWMEKYSEIIVEGLESVFSKNSRNLEVVGRFSNGETVYRESKQAL